MTSTCNSPPSPPLGRIQGTRARCKDARPTFLGRLLNCSRGDMMASIDDWEKIVIFKMKIDIKVLEDFENVKNMY